MRIPEISFEGIGTESKSFLKRLANGKLFLVKNVDLVLADDFEEVRIDFKGIKPEDGLNIEDVATLALLVRTIAQAGKRAIIKFPQLYQGRPSRIHRFLERLGFRSLFEGDSSKYSWLKNIQIDAPAGRMASLPLRSGITNYVPLRWFDMDDFDYDQSISIWKAHFTLKSDLDRQLRTVLQSHGFADLDTVDLLTKTMFLELGLNAVLHSQYKPGAGFGVFCGQVGESIDAKNKLRQPEITFCIADLGRGIPATLGDSYHKNPDWKDFHRQNKISEQSAIIRYAIDPNSTSRPELPSDHDAAGYRGLALVSSALQGRGDILIRSAGGAVRLTGRVDGTKASPRDSFRQCPIPGTQVVGRLRIKTKKADSDLKFKTRAHFPQVYVNLVCDFNGECSALSDATAARQFAAKTISEKETVVFDLGYADKSTRSLEYLCKSVIPLNPNKFLIFWNVSTPWTQLASLDKWIAEQAQINLAMPCLIVRGFGDIRCFGATKTIAQRWLKELIDRQSASNMDDNGDVGRRLWLTSEEYLELTFVINSSFLSRGFETTLRPNGTFGNADSGFFTGTIHMLRGGHPTSRYFSLTTNLNSARNSNLRRWSEACAVALTRLLDRTPIDDTHLVLLGFTGTMREVMARMILRIQRRCRAYMLLTFDIPTKEEIAAKVKKGDKVVLVTDVVLTGTLVESVGNLVRRVGGNIAGVVSLVDGREFDDSAESMIAAGFDRVPLITCSKIQTPEQEQVQLSERQYWVDPVSLIPSPTKTWGWSSEVDAKIERTMNLIMAAKAALCGHIVDGTRHTSVYVNLQKLLIEQDLPLQEQINTVCDDRLKARGWDDFNPAMVLYPSGISRIESVLSDQGSHPQIMDGESVTVYHTAVKTYVEKLRRKWKDFTAIEVLRAFDPGGGSRCATTIERPDKLKGNASHIVVADDGVWRGNTINSLVQIARRLGANRILVIPLLARISPAIAQQFELIHSVESIEGAGQIDICYAFPLLLPIPYYGEHECPYDITIKRIRDRRLRLPSLENTANRLVSNLAGRTPVDSNDAAEFNDTWLRFRVYVELASEHEGILEIINRELETLANPDGLLAVFQMFSSEWSLLGRARLRQTVRPTLRTRSECVAVNEHSRSDVRIAAFTVLRSLFCESFIEHLSRVTNIAVEDPELLCRLVFQIATLNEPWRQHQECIHFLEEISDHASAAAARHSHKWSLETFRNYFEAVTVCKSLSLELKAVPENEQKTKRAAAIQLQRLLTEDRTFKHQVRRFIEILAGSSESIHDFDAGNFQSFSRAWNADHEPMFVKVILPCLASLHHLLLQTGTHGYQVISEDIKFLEGKAEAVRDAVSSLSSGLQFLQELPDNIVFKKGVVQAASYLMKDVAGQRSTTMRLLEQMKQVTVGQLVDDFAKEIESNFAALKLNIRVQKEGTADVNLSSHIFAPPQLIALCTGNVLDNLVRYAFPCNGSRSETAKPLISICLEHRRTEANEPIIRVSIKNNGHQLRSGAVMGNGGRRAATALERFGGEYCLPMREIEMPWRVAHHISFLLW